MVCDSCSKSRIESHRVCDRCYQPGSTFNYKSSSKKSEPDQPQINDTKFEPDYISHPKQNQHQQSPQPPPAAFTPNANMNIITNNNFNDNNFNTMKAEGSTDSDSNNSSTSSSSSN